MQKKKKKDLKNVTGSNESNLAAKSELASLKDKLNVNKLKTTPAYLITFRNVVKKS